MTQNIIKKQELQIKSTNIKNFSLISKRFFETFTKAEINSWNFYEKIQNMLINIMKNVKNASHAIIARSNANASRAFPLFSF